MKKNNWKYQIGYTVGAIGGFTLGFIRGFITVGLIIGAIVLLLTGCMGDEAVDRLEMRDSAMPISSIMYKTTSGELIEVVENLDGYKIVLWHNSYGSDMEVLFHIESDSLWKKEIGYGMD